MKPRRQRLALVAVGIALLGLATWLVLSAFRENLVFFYTPTQIAAGEAPRAGLFRLGGMVEKGSVRRHADGVTVSFTVTDMRQAIDVQYRGALPDLFREGKGVVAQGRLADGRRFAAQEVLAKHDENYMPPEAAYALAQGAAKEKHAAGDR
jgi:cytochrome c-type biogenesis protein CcmE